MRASPQLYYTFLLEQLNVSVCLPLGKYSLTLDCNSESSGKLENDAQEAL